MSPIDFNNIQTVQFGVCLDTEDGEVFCLVPADPEVKIALRDMFDTTKAPFENSAGEPPLYELSEKYDSTDRLQLPLTHAMMGNIRDIYNAQNIHTNPNAIYQTSQIISYFAIFWDRNNNKAIGVRRAQSFKGILKARNKLVRIVNESLQLIQNDVFKLDNDFDFIVYDDKVFIYRPSGFEFTADLKAHILEKASEYTTRIEQEITFLNLAGLSDYVAKHPRAARLIASLRSRNDLHLIDKELFKNLCDSNSVAYTIENEKITPSEKHEMAFLYLLDRRRYSLKLIPNTPELYEAPSRRMVSS